MMLESYRFAAFLCFVVLGSLHGIVATDRGDSRLTSRRDLKKSKASKEGAKARDLCSCEMHSGSTTQTFTSVPPAFPVSISPGDFFTAIVEKPFLDIVDIGINTCQLVWADGPPDNFQNYYLSCQMLARGKFGIFTAAGNGAPNDVTPKPQPVLYAITGGTGDDMGAWGEFSTRFDPLYFDEEKQQFASGFDYNLTLCY